MILHSVGRDEDSAGDIGRTPQTAADEGRELPSPDAVVTVKIDGALGRTLMIYICLFMVLSGIVLFIADRLGLVACKAKASVAPLARACHHLSLSLPRCCRQTRQAILRIRSMARCRRAQCGPWPAPAT